MISFIISSTTETARTANIALMLKQLPEAELIEAVYPSLIRVPFLAELVTKSKTRTGRSLLPAEIGCLLSHRKVWKRIISMNISEAEHCLILESDSIINNLSLVNQFFDTTKQIEELPNISNKAFLLYYDIFFFGAWYGHMKFLRSKKQPLDRIYTIGEPFIKSVYCTYGYSVNKKAARYLLQKTKKIAYPVDQFKQYILPEELRLGGILPELISAGTLGSYINQIDIHNWKNKLFMHLLDVKNAIVCFLK